MCSSGWIGLKLLVRPVILSRVCCAGRGEWGAGPARLISDIVHNYGDGKLAAPLSPPSWGSGARNVPHSHTESTSSSCSLAAVLIIFLASWLCLSRSHVMFFSDLFQNTVLIVKHREFAISLSRYSGFLHSGYFLRK